MTIDEMPEHNHGLKYALMGAPSGANAFAPRSSAVDGTTSNPINSAGGGEAFSIVQPSFVCLHVIQAV